MERIVWLSIFLIFVVSCQAQSELQGNTGQDPASSTGMKNQKLDGSITPGASQQLLNSFQRLVTKAFNDLENRIEDKISQLQRELNDNLDSMDSKTENRLNDLDNRNEDRLNDLDNRNENRLKDLDSRNEDRLTQLQKFLNDKLDLLENRMEDRFKSTDEKLVYLQTKLYMPSDSSDRENDNEEGQFQNISGNKNDTCETKINSKLVQLQSDLNARIDAFENVLDNKLDTLHIKLDNTFENKSISDSMGLLDDQISKELADSKTDILNSMGTLIYRTEETQRRNLENFSGRVENTLNRASGVMNNLASSKKRWESDLKNYTEAVLDVLTSWENSTQCLQKVVKPLCHRGMAKDTTTSYQPLELLMDPTLNRDILCDTQTDGGGWIVIQRRTKNDVDFYKTWEDYKNGFGLHPGDFWLGNDAIHELTGKHSYELRVELTDGSRDYFAVYSSFKIESEQDNYRLRLGSRSGTLGEDSTKKGLSYHNGHPFSTYDRDNDARRAFNCAQENRGGWWYYSCTRSNLNGLWGEQSTRGVFWGTGSINHFASSTEMKIRRV